MALYDNFWGDKCSDCGALTNPRLWPFVKTLCISCFKKYLAKISHFKEPTQ